MTHAPNSAAYYVLDACGEKFLFTLAGLDYEPRFRKHAKWWLGYIARSHGRSISQPVKPCRVVVAPYYDKSGE